jgi:hypothetical protein
MSEKSAMQSKKFVAYMVGDLSWTVLLGGGIYWTMSEQSLGLVTVLLAMVIVKGFVSTGYIISQAALDKYTRVAEIASGKGGGGAPPTEG